MCEMDSFVLHDSATMSEIHVNAQGKKIQKKYVCCVGLHIVFM